MKAPGRSRSVVPQSCSPSGRSLSAIRIPLLGLMVAAGAAVALAGATGVAPARAVRVLSRIAVPAQPSPANNVRWASDSSVYLSRYYDGIAEVSLDPALTVRKRIVPSVERFGSGFRSYDTFAVSQGHIAVAESHQFASTTVQPAEDGTRVFARQPLLIGDDLDLYGRRLVLLGYPREAGDPENSQGGFVWLGTLDQPLAEFRPVLRDVTGGKMRAVDSCLFEWLGAVRFLAGGSFVVVAGVQPGVHLFDPAGNLVRTWDNRELGLDLPGCADLPKAEVKALNFSSERRLARVNQMHVVDDVLPLPEGPGLLVRSFAHGEVSWVLEVLKPTGVVTYAIPFTSSRPFDRLRGDVRGDRIVLLRSPHVTYKAGGLASPAELIVAEAPRG